MTDIDMLVAPPPPPPDRLGISMLCIELETGKIMAFKQGDSWVGRSPWLYTYAEVHYRMAPDGEDWKPVKDKTYIVVIDIQRHTIKSIEIE